MKRDDLRALVREALSELLDEMTTTGAVAGYETPNAFGNKRKRKKIATNSTGYDVVKELDEGFDAQELGIKWHSVKEAQNRRLKYLRSRGRHHPDEKKRKKYNEAATKLQHHMTRDKK
jgi:hypothetical protein